MPQMTLAELGSPALRSALEEALGAVCLIHFSRPEKKAPAVGRLIAILNGQTVIRLEVPLSDAPLSQVSVHSEDPPLVFECNVTERPDNHTLVLSYPFWLSSRERRSAPRVDLILPCRVALDANGDIEWHSGVIENMSLAGLRLQSPLNVDPATPLLVRVSMPVQPRPLLLHIRCAWCIQEGELYTIGGPFVNLSLQAERTLQITLGSLITPRQPPEGV